MSEKFRIARRLEGLARQENLWVQYSALALKHKALNFGQGFPDYLPPKHVTDALAAVGSSGNNSLHQYTRGFGHPRLVQALSRLYSAELQRQVDPLDHVLISNGAYVSLHSVISSMVDTDDEVVILEPFFDCYAPMVEAAGGRAIYAPLRPPTEEQQRQRRLVRSADEWRWDNDELEAAFGPRTKMLIVNTPNNPTGKVLTGRELQQLADLCCRHDVVCVSDEVYERLVYPGARHQRIAALPGMWHRTVTIGSAGKTFSVTGWKLGWAIGPPAIIANMRVVHQNSCYTCPTPTQEAVAVAVETELQRQGTADCYFDSLAAELLPKRDRVAQLLTEFGLPVYLPAGGYFMLADVSHLPEPPSTKEEEEEEEESAKAAKECRDVRLSKWLTAEHRLATIPCSCFYSPAHKPMGERFIRFCFIKSDDTIEALRDRLASWLG